MKWLAVLLALTASAQPTPFQLETGHNTAACSNDNTQDYCTGGFPVGTGPWRGGWGDQRPNVLTPVIHPGVGDYANSSGYSGNISNGRGTPPWPDPANPGDIHNLLYPGNTTKVLAIVQMWFSATGQTAPITVCLQPNPDGSCPPKMGQVLLTDTGYSGQKVVGYTSNDGRYVAAMVDDLWNRGFDGVVAYVGTGPNQCANVTLASGNYTGQQNNFTASCGTGSSMAFIDSGLQTLQQAMLKYPASQFQFVIQFAGSYKWPITCGCQKSDCSGVNDTYQAQCIRDQMRAQIDYYASGFFKGANYLTPAPNSPVLQFFMDEAQTLVQCNTRSCTIDAQSKTTCSGKQACWNAIWQDLRAYSKQQHNLTPYLIFRGAPAQCPVLLDSGSCTASAAPVTSSHVEADGYYTFTQPTIYSMSSSAADQIAGQENWGRCAYQSTYCSWAATPKLNNRRALFWGAAWKGVDDLFWSDATATRTSGLITSQRCGQTWLDTFAAPGNSFNRTNQLPYMLVATYDDHEAGSAFQPGIDNCASVTASVTGTALQWTTAFSDTKYGSLKTLDHYRLFDSPDGVNVSVLLDNIPVSQSGTLDLAALPVPVAAGNHVLYLKLVSKPGILNKVSKPMPATTLTLTKSGPGSVTIGSTIVNCAGTCTNTMLAGTGTSVTLTANPTTGHQFTGFSSACPCPPGQTCLQCTLPMSAATQVTATFQ